MNQRIQRTLLTLFSLLQCVSPLSHAHADGMNVGHATSIHEIDVRSLTCNTHAENHEGAIISIPHAYLQSASLSLPPPAIHVIALYSPLDISEAASRLPAAPGFSITDTRYSSPWAQAPPRTAPSA